MLIVSLALAMFWMPAEAGEKVSLGITVMLAFSVFQLVIAEQTPKTSEFYPVLGTISVSREERLLVQRVARLNFTSISKSMFRS